MISLFSDRSPTRPSHSRLSSRFSSRLALCVCIALLVSALHMLYSAQYGPLPYAKPPPTSLSPSPTNLTTAHAPPFFSSAFPRKIWQTAKTSPAGLSEAERGAIHSWTTMNQKWRYEIVTQYSAESYVRETFADRPDIEEVFRDLQDPILRADLIRYLVLLGDGGVYSDIDTVSRRPIEDWVPWGYRDVANVVVGVEYDRLDGQRWSDWTLDLQFCTWAILAKPRHPLLELTVQRVLASLRQLAFRQGKTIAGVHASFDEVLDTTGPAIFTGAVFEILTATTGTRFTWENVTRLRQPKLVGDVLILPIAAFGSGQGHSGSPAPEDEGALVQHLFKGSWKADHPKEEAKPEVKVEVKPETKVEMKPEVKEEMKEVPQAVATEEGTGDTGRAQEGEKAG